MHPSARALSIAHLLQRKLFCNIKIILMKILIFHNLIAKHAWLINILVKLNHSNMRMFTNGGGNKCHRSAYCQFLKCRRCQFYFRSNQNIWRRMILYKTDKKNLANINQSSKKSQSQLFRPSWCNRIAHWRGSTGICQNIVTVSVSVFN